MQPGETAKVDIRHRHTLANESKEEVKFLCRLEPGHEGFEQAIYVVHGLAEDGMTDSGGVPKNIVSLAIVAEMMDTWLTGWSFCMASPLLLLLRRYGKGTGHERRLLGSIGTVASLLLDVSSAKADLPTHEDFHQPFRT